MFFKVFLNIFSGRQFNHGLTRMDTDLASVFKGFIKGAGRGARGFGRVKWGFGAEM
jgi:hypothetical protein